MSQFRADVGVSDRPLVVPNVGGGLDTLTPAHKLAPSQSPDLLNVVLNNGAATKRGGFIPLVREQPKISSLRNVGVRSSGRTHIASAVNTDYIQVPGACYAGHRTAWDDAEIRDGVTIDFFCVIDDLSTSHGGNGAQAGGPFSPSPYTIKVRPILSKGPVKRTADPTQLGAPHTTGLIAWQTTSRWGPLGAGSHAMPFCVYLYNNAGTWEFRFSFHYWNSAAAQWELKTLGTPITALGGVQIDTLYQVTVGYGITTNSVFVRIGSRFETGTPSYVMVFDTIHANAQAMAAMTPTPVQLFDCPQEFIEAPVAASATRPPGLGLSALADGGYWFAAVRFEGRVEDVVVYRGFVAAASGALDRTGRIDPDSPPYKRLQHWPIEGRSDDVIEDVAGLGNHFYRSPAGPVWDPVSGGLNGGSLVFNGVTSYALIETGAVGRYAWRLASDPSTMGAFEGVLKLNYSHGIEVAFWMEAHEPNFEQVIFEIHSVIRLVIRYDGFLQAYVRDGTAAPASPQYQNAGTSTNRLIPGNRYHVIVMRSGASVDLVINGVRDTQTAVAPVSATGWPVSGITLGMGSHSFTSRSAVGTVDATTAPSDSINTDSRSGFFGRIEYCRLLMGEYPFLVPVPAFGGEVPGQHKMFAEEDLTVRLNKHFDYPNNYAGARNSQTPVLAGEDPLPNLVAGHVVSAEQHRVATGELHPSPVTSAAATGYVTFGIPGRTFQSIYHIYTMLGVRRALGAWDFDVPVDEFGYPGGYSSGNVETIGTAPVQANVQKAVHIHRFYTDDLMEIMGPVQLRCAEGDILKEFDASGGWTNWARRYKPYLTRSPKALSPLWSAGLLRPSLGENPIAMISSWTEETSGESFLMAGCRRSLYWAKRPWRQGSPFRSEVTAEALWFFGQRGDHCRAATMTAHGSGTTWGVGNHRAFVDLWVNPTRLDGKRLIACYGNVIGSTLRYLIYTNQGRLGVMGQNVGGGLWHYFEGTTAAGPDRELGEVTIALQKWSHVQLDIGNGTLTARINGQRVTMTRTVASVLIDAGNIPAATDLWIGGMDPDQMRMVSVPILFQPWHGLITDIRERSTEDTTYWDAGESGVPPTSRAVDDGNTRWLYAASSDTGWSVPCSTAGIPSLKVAIRELVGLRHDLGDAQRVACSATAFRNELVVAWPTSPPQRVRFLGFDSLSGPFSCHRLGMHAPQHQDTHYYSSGTLLVGSDDASAATFVPADVSYQVYTSFKNELGEESEAELTGSGPAPAADRAVLQAFEIPRSSDPQVVARNIYLSINGAAPLFVGELRDNETYFYEIQNRGSGIAAPTVGNQLAAPIARKVAVGSGVLVLANLEDNPNSFAASGAETGYFPLTRIVTVDSEDGEAVISAITQLGVTYIFKRDGTWAFQATSLQDIAFGAGLRPVNATASAAGGAAVYDNVIYGASDRGVWMFDGSNYVYASPPLEGEFDDVATDAAGLLAHQGAFFEGESQYWLSVRLRGEDYNHRVYVLHPGSAPAWSKLDLPPHIALARIDNIETRRSRLGLGTIHGQILIYDPETSIDGVRDVDHHLGAQVLSGTPGSSTTTTLTISAGNLDVAYDGLRGCLIQFLDANGDLLATRTIVSNTATVITWEGAYTIPSGATFAVGGIAAYWSSPWIAPQRYGNYLRAEFIDLDFEPAASTLRLANLATVSLATDRTFATATAEQRGVDLSRGYLNQPIATRTERNGRYFRIRFGTNGVRQPFSVTGYGLRFGDSGTQGGPS